MHVTHLRDEEVFPLHDTVQHVIQSRGRGCWFGVLNRRVETVAGAGGGAVSAAGACPAGAGVELEADGSGVAWVEGASWAAAKKLQDKNRRNNPELKRAIRIRTFREF